MKKKLLIYFIFSITIITIVGLFFYYNSNQNMLDNLKGEYIICLNDVDSLLKEGNYTEAQSKISELQNIMRQKDFISNSNILILTSICLVSIFLLFLYIYLRIVKPFSNMEKYVCEIARGNFDVNLNYERGNFFGEFTWAFDSMRREINTARKSEKNAIINNKTVISTLSHDIRTPIASIRAYSEALQANLDNSIEKRMNYLNVIIKKCDEVSKLTNDLFLHSLSDLDKIKMNFEDVNICRLLEEIINEQSINIEINYNKPDFEAVLFIDKNRFIQLVENIISNTNKYAKTAIDIALLNETNYVRLTFKDHGNGIADKDMPFIFDKFYRGMNSKNEQGSGLGLYIVKYIVDSFKGEIHLYNDNGLVVDIKIPKK